MHTFKKFLLAIAAMLAFPVTVFLAVFAMTASSTPAIPGTVSTDAALPRVTLDNAVFHSEAFGNSSHPVVLVLHGGPGGDYRSLLPLQALADRFFVVFYDQRGSGLSPRLPYEQLGLEAALKDVALFVNHYGKGRKVHLIGHDWGGMLAAAYATRNPQQIASLTLADPGFLTNDMAKEIMGDMTQQSAGFILNTARDWVASFHIHGPDPEARQDFMLSRIRVQAKQRCNPETPEPPDRLWRAGFLAWRAITQSTFSPEGKIQLQLLDPAKPLKQPLLLLASSCNQITGSRFQARQVSLFPQARLVTLSEAGLHMFADQPQASVNAVRKFLTELP
jgi:proline iminopeptidase